MKGRLIDYLMIVPDAHVRVLDFEYQMMLYELFHTSRLTRTMHLLLTPVVMFGYFAVAASVPHGALVLGVLILVWYGKLDMLVAVTATPALAGMWLLADHWHTLSPETAGWWGLAMIFGGGALESLSHSVEALPPPWSGTEAFLPGKAILSGVPRWMIVVLMLAGVTLFAVLELMSSSRIFAVQVAGMLARCGHRPQVYADATRTARQILAGERVLADHFLGAPSLRSASPVS